jgi:hypothetical protein
VLAPEGLLVPLSPGPVSVSDVMEMSGRRQALTWYAVALDLAGLATPDVQAVGPTPRDEEGSMPSDSTEWANKRMRGRKPPDDVFEWMGRGSKRGGRFPLHEVDPETLGAAVIRWCSQGFAMSLSLSSDGGAFGVHCIVSGRKESEWHSDVRELEDFLTTIPGPVDRQEG